MKQTSLRLLALVTALLLAGCITESTGQPEVRPNPEEAAMVNLQLGAEYLRKGDLETAVGKLQKAVDQNPKLAQAHATLALAYERLGLANDAADHYKKALRVANNDPAIENTYGAHLCRSGNYADAEQYFMKAAHNPRYRTPEAAFANAGVCAARGEDLDKAESHFRSALRINPRYADALWNMADISFRRDRDLQARAFLERLSSIGPLPAGALWLGHRVESRLGDGSAADDYAQRLKARYPDSRETALLLDRESNGG